MVKLQEMDTVIRTSGNADHVVSTYLRVYLSNKKLTDKELMVTSALVCKYAEYVTNGVLEPYASIILFSTETRREIVSQLKISPAHLNNTFDTLTKKDILAKEGGRYLMNPDLVPTRSLIFEFSIVP
jgi:hypothetical protein